MNVQVSYTRYTVKGITCSNQKLIQLEFYFFQLSIGLEIETCSWKSTQRTNFQNIILFIHS